MQTDQRARLCLKEMKSGGERMVANCEVGHGNKLLTRLGITDFPSEQDL